MVSLVKKYAVSNAWGVVTYYDNLKHSDMLKLINLGYRVTRVMPSAMVRSYD